MILNTDTQTEEEADAKGDLLKETEIDEAIAEDALQIAETDNNDRSHAVEEKAAAGTESSVGALEDLLVYENRSISEEALQADENVDYDGYIFKISDDATRTEKKEVEEAVEDFDATDDGAQVEPIEERTLYTADSLETISEVAGADIIEYIEPDVKCELFEDTSDGSAELQAESFTSTPNDPYYIDRDYAWAWNKTAVPDAWKMGYYGQDRNGGKVTVVVIDSGVAANHPDINYSNIDSRGVTFFNGTTESGYADEYGHGTFVTGVINARMNNSKGVTGSMPGLNVLPIKIYKKTANGLEGGYISDIIKAINKAIEIKADVVNMSFGTKSNVLSLENACKAATDAGIILIASVGNDGSDVVNYPAGCSGVIGVGSVSAFLVKASSSNFNSTVDCVAAGLSVAGLALGSSSSSDSYYKIGSGTSYSAPQVAALAGMAKSIDRNIDAYDFLNILKDTCRDMGATGRDDSYGYGVVNFGKAATAALDEALGEASSNEGEGSTEGESNKEPIVGEIQPEPVSISSAKLSTKYSTYTYTGDLIMPAVTVTLNGKLLTKGTDYSVSYSDNMSVGIAKATVTGRGSYTGTRTISFNIVPKGTNISSAKKYSKALRVKWTKRTSAMAKYRITGYQVQVAKNSSFSKGLKSYKVKGYSKYYKKITGLKRKTKYYTRVRTYMTVNGKTYYSTWSGSKKYKTK
ncbi:MAG: S8 family serine peptidase [Mogibacterium sp.]|nr:S8 family serine peptidase [Mogibacterium sp.]